MTASALVLCLFIAWTLALLVLMETVRSYLVFTRKVRANAFDPGNSNLSPFMQRLARAHANCLEGLPVFGGVLLLAIATGHADLTDPLAPWLLAARIAQSCIHLASLHVLAVNARSTLFAVQVAIAIRWVWLLLAQ